MNDKIAVYLVWGLVAVVFIYRLLTLKSDGKVENSDKAKAERLRRAWRGDYGPEARQQAVDYSRDNWRGVRLFGAAMVVLAVAAVVWCVS